VRVTEVTEVTEFTEVTEATEATEAAEVTEATEVTEVTEVSLVWQPETYFSLTSVFQLNPSHKLSDVFISPFQKGRKYVLLVTKNEKCRILTTVC